MSLKKQQVEEESEAPQWSTVSALKKAKLDSMIAVRQGYARTIAEAENAKKGLDQKISALLIAADIEKVKVGEISVKLVIGSNVRIDEKSLLKQGVTADKIAKAKEAGTTTYTYLSVREPKASDG